MFRFRHIATLLVLVLWTAAEGGIVHAQGAMPSAPQESHRIYFRPGIESLYYPYRTNRAVLNAIISDLSQNPDAQVNIRVYASLEGDIFRRGELVQERGRILSAWLQWACGIRPSQITIEPIFDWGRSLEPWADIDITRSDSHELAFARGISSAQKLAELPAVETLNVIPATTYTYRTFLAIRTNALAVPFMNVGVEVPLGKHFSLGADWYYPWIPRNNGGKCIQILAGGAEVRYWFGKDRLIGHSVGLFGMGGMYDLEWNYHGFQGEFALAGVDYLFSRPILNDQLRLEFSLGLGAFFSQAKEYRVYGNGEIGFTDKNMAKEILFIGPVKATVSLVVPLRIKKKNY